MKRILYFFTVILFYSCGGTTETTVLEIKGCTDKNLVNYNPI